MVDIPLPNLTGGHSNAGATSGNYGTTNGNVNIGTSSVIIFTALILTGFLLWKKLK